MGVWDGLVDGELYAVVGCDFQEDFVEGDLSGVEHEDAIGGIGKV